MVRNELVIPKVWRSELKGVGLFLFFSVLAIFLTRTFPGSVIEGDLISLGSYSVVLALPLFWFIPFVTLMHTIIRIYDVRYIVDNRGIESRVGILSMHQRITRVRYEDVRSVELEQSILERILDIGDLEISTAATGAVEIVFQGISAPQEVRDMLQRERDSRQKSRYKQNKPDSKSTQNSAQA